MGKNTFARMLRVTFYAVEHGPDGIIRVKKPLQPTDYVLSPFTLEDMDAVDQWIRQKMLDRFIATTKQLAGITRQEFIEMVATETRRVSAIGWTCKEGVKELSCADGLAFMVSQALVGEEGEYLGPEELKELLQAPENQEQAQLCIKRLDSLDAWGVENPTRALSEGRNPTTKKANITEYLQKQS